MCVCACVHVCARFALVCKSNLEVLHFMEEQPVIDLASTNPSLYSHVPELLDAKVFSLALINLSLSSYSLAFPGIPVVGSCV